MMSGSKALDCYGEERIERMTAVKGKNTGNKRTRFAFLDTLRGMMLVSMILYHGCWNLVYLYGKDWQWYRYSKGAYFWQQSICCTFIFLSGFCFLLGKRKIRNGLLIFFSGALVSVVTGLVMPQNMVRFGVLTCIGSCILLTAFLESLLISLPARQSALISLLLFIFTKDLNQGFIGVGTRPLVKLPAGWYSSSFSAYLGFPPTDFSSTDYFSLLPWLFLFWTGFFVFRLLKSTGIWKLKLMQLSIPPFAQLGRHSLFIYLVHQPILYLLGEIFLQSLKK